MAGSGTDFGFFGVLGLAGAGIEFRLRAFDIRRELRPEPNKGQFWRVMRRTTGIVRTSGGHGQAGVDSGAMPLRVRGPWPYEG